MVEQTSKRPRVKNFSWVQDVSTGCKNVQRENFLKLHGKCMVACACVRAFVWIKLEVIFFLADMAVNPSFVLTLLPVT